MRLSSIIIVELIRKFGQWPTAHAPTDLRAFGLRLRCALLLLPRAAQLGVEALAREGANCSGGVHSWVTTLPDDVHPLHLGGTLCILDTLAASCVHGQNVASAQGTLPPARLHPTTLMGPATQEPPKHSDLHLMCSHILAPLPHKFEDLSGGLPRRAGSKDRALLSQG